MSATTHLPMAGAAAERGRSVWLHRYAICTAAATMFLLFAGALVTSNSAGLSVPDWPLSYGKLMPPMVGGIFYEHGHRMVATFVGLLTIGLAVWTWRVDSRAWVRRLGWNALALVCVQGVFGGLTVLFKLPLAVSTAHACLAQIFFCVTVSMAMFTSPRWGEQPGVWDHSSRVQRLAMLATLAIFIQLLLGALYRHGGTDWVPHVTGAMVVTTLVFMTLVWTLGNPSTTPGVRTAAITLAALVLAQLFLGGASLGAKIYYAEAPQPMPVFVWVTAAHLVTGALALAAAVGLTLLLLRARRLQGSFAA